MVFYNPVVDRFSTSADYLLDKGRNIGDVFPSIRYDGGLVTSVLSNKDDKPMKFDIDERVFIQCQKSYDRLAIVAPPTSKSNFYTVPMNDGEEMNVETKDIYITYGSSIRECIGVIRILCSEMVETRSKGDVIAS